MTYGNLITVLAAILALPWEAQAFTDSMLIADVTPGTINVDGSTQDWYDAQYPAATLGKNEIVFGASSWDGEDDYAMDAFVAHDEANLYLALAVDDDRQVRTKSPGGEEDHVEIWIELPPYGENGRQVILFHPERNFPTFHPSLRLASGGKEKKLKGAKFTMESGDAGWEAEIVIPLDSIPGLWKSLAASRWAIVAVDSDTKAGTPERQTVMATAGTHDAGTWSPEVVETHGPRLEPVDGVFQGFLEGQKVGEGQVDVRYADVASDARLEMLVSTGPVVAVMGPGFMSGTSYSYVRLPVQGPSDVLAYETRDVTADGKADIVVRYRESNDLGSRVVVAVYSFVVTELRRILAQEVKVSQGDKSISCNVQFLPDGPGGSEMVLVTKGKAKGWSDVSYKNVPEYGVGAVLAPWEAEERRLWVIAGFEFKKAEADRIDSYLEAKPEKKGKKKKKKAK